MAKNTHPAIIARDDFEKVQKILNKNRAVFQTVRAKSEQIRAEYQNDLAGMVFCADCGRQIAKRILTTVEGAKVVGLDNMNHYYDVRLKEARLDELNKFENFSFVKGNLADKETITTIFEQYKPQIVVNLGAQAGVR